MFAWQSNGILDILPAGSLKHPKITRNFFTAGLFSSSFSIRHPKMFSILFLNSQKLRIKKYQECFCFRPRPQHISFSAKDRNVCRKSKAFTLCNVIFAVIFADQKIALSFSRLLFMEEKSGKAWKRGRDVIQRPHEAIKNSVTRFCCCHQRLVKWNTPSNAIWENSYDNSHRRNLRSFVFKFHAKDFRVSKEENKITIQQKNLITSCWNWYEKCTRKTHGVRDFEGWFQDSENKRNNYEF